MHHIELLAIKTGSIMINLYHTIHNIQLNASDVNNCTWILILVHLNDLDTRKEEEEEKVKCRGSELEMLFIKLN